MSAWMPCPSEIFRDTWVIVLLQLEQPITMATPRLPILTAIGFNAAAGPTSIAIGANAKAGIVQGETSINSTGVFQFVGPNNNAPVVQLNNVSNSPVTIGPKSRLFTVSSAKRIIEKLSACKPVSVSIDAASGQLEVEQMGNQLVSMFKAAKFADVQFMVGFNSIADPHPVIVILAQDSEPQLIDAIDQLFIEVGQKPDVLSRAPNREG